MQEGKYDPKGKSDKLLTELREKRLAFLEFQRECAKWLLEPEIWNTFHPKNFPSKTDKILEHEAMPHSTRKDLGKKYYEDNPEIMDYFNKTLAILTANEQRVIDLSEFLDAIDNAEQYEKLKAKRAEFQKAVARQGSEMRIKRYVYNNPEYKRVAKEFEGRIV